MLAAFPMYDRPETRDANDRLWALTRERLGYGPAELTRAYDLDLWSLWESPDLLLTQTCGLPLRTRLAGKVDLVGSLINTLPGCPPGHYFSRIVVNKQASSDYLPDYAEARFAFNQSHSQSGWAAAQNHAAEMGFRFTNATETGAHRMSARAVAEGRADIAVIDAVSWSMIDEYDDFARELKVIANTIPTPGEPVITAPGQDVAALAEALSGAIAALTPEDRTTLRLTGLVPADQLSFADYAAIPNPPGPDQRA